MALSFAYFPDPMQSNIITVIPVYNGERYIRATLESVAAQTVKRVFEESPYSVDRPLSGD